MTNIESRFDMLVIDAQEKLFYYNEGHRITPGNDQASGILKINTGNESSNSYSFIVSSLLSMQQFKKKS